MSLYLNVLTVQLEIMILGVVQTGVDHLQWYEIMRYHFASVIFFQLFYLVLQKTTYWNIFGHSGDDGSFIAILMMVQNQSD